MSCSNSFHDNAIDYFNEEGGILVFAAGNDGRDGEHHYPGCHPDVVGVGAVQQTGVRASWSNYGSVVDISAPGVSIYSTVPESKGSYPRPRRRLSSL